jgi:hypothetical protein
MPLLMANARVVNARMIAVAAAAKTDNLPNLRRIVSLISSLGLKQLGFKHGDGTLVDFRKYLDGELDSNMRLVNNKTGYENPDSYELVVKHAWRNVRRRYSARPSIVWLALSPSEGFATAKLLALWTQYLCDNVYHCRRRGC